MNFFWNSLTVPVFPKFELIEKRLIRPKIGGKIDNDLFDLEFDGKEKIDRQQVILETLDSILDGRKSYAIAWSSDGTFKFGDFDSEVSVEEIFCEPNW